MLRMIFPAWTIGDASFFAAFLFGLKFVALVLIRCRGRLSYGRRACLCDGQPVSPHEIASQQGVTSITSSCNLRLVGLSGTETPF